MNVQDYLRKLSTIIVGNNWDLPTPGAESNLKKKYYGSDNLVQENLKTEGRKLRVSANLDNQLLGYGLEAYSHYCRSQESATEQKRKHPEESSDYFSHWLYSDPDYIEKSAFKVLSKWFSKPSSVKIAPGKTYWKH